ncbi:hypothetical protein B0H66DRAFT_258010 [Apodospora peruviana]|uniref:FAR1 domain-containing protein n=1 Tax=Apodospora peruviana TaxID=516989 RepID=A0AAE0I699_9PEZI|nr:hypothetical protein B0H66DRAFT_258010 [Apodospora peruviana]
MSYTHLWTSPTISASHDDTASSKQDIKEMAHHQRQQQGMQMQMQMQMPPPGPAAQAPNPPQQASQSNTTTHQFVAQLHSINQRPQQQQQQQQQHQPSRPNFQMALLPPPQDRLYPTFEALNADLKAFTRSQGYACTIVSSLNRSVEGQYRRYNLCCSKGGKSYASHSRGIRNTRSTKTGCPMKLKAIQEKAYPYDDKWRVVVQCAEHNHPPFTGEPDANVPAQFRKIEQDGVRWLMVMHREAQCSLRQLTIGIRISFGEKYQYVKKSDVRNMLAKIKREEERKAAAAAALQGLPTNLPYTIIPPEHRPPTPEPIEGLEMMPSLPQGMQVPDPDLESDDDDDEEHERDDLLVEDTDRRGGNKTVCTNN